MSYSEDLKMQRLANKWKLVEFMLEKPKGFQNNSERIIIEHTNSSNITIEQLRRLFNRNKNG